METHLPLHRDWELLTTSQTGTSSTKSPTTVRYATYIPLVALHGLEQYSEQNLFIAARRAHLTFDMQKSLGSLLLLIDSITSGSIMTMNMGETPMQALEGCIKTMEFLLKQAGGHIDKQGEPYRRLIGMMEQR